MIEAIVFHAYRLWLKLAYSVAMVNAYLASSRGDRLSSVQYEQKAYSIYRQWQEHVCFRALR
jgi:hypothetical protein